MCVLKINLFRFAIKFLLNKYKNIRYFINNYYIYDYVYNNYDKYRNMNIFSLYI